MKMYGAGKFADSDQTLEDYVAVIEMTWDRIDATENNRYHAYAYSHGGGYGPVEDKSQESCHASDC